MLRIKFTAVLQDILGYSIDDICLSLYDEGLLKEPAKDGVLAEPTKQDRAFELVRLLNRPDSCRARELIYEACKEHEVYLICDAMNPDCAPHEPMTHEEPSCPQELETDWVERQVRDSENGDPYRDLSPSFERIKGLKCQLVDNDILFRRHIGNKDYYQMTSSIRGQVTMLYEIGRQHLDWKILDRFSKEFNFADPVITKRIEAPRDLEDLDLTVNRNGRTVEYDCPMLFILARGHDGVFNGNERNGLKTVIEKMKREPFLANKPKIIFYMTLKSGDSDGAMPHMGAMKDMSQPGNGEAEGPVNISDACDDLYFVQVTDYGCEMLQTNDKKDHFIRFIQLIVDAFLKDAKTLEFLRLLSCLNMKYEKPVAKCRFTGRRKLYFFPGCRNGSDECG